MGNLAVLPETEQLTPQERTVTFAEISTASDGSSSPTRPPAARPPAARVAVTTNHGDSNAAPSAGVFNLLGASYDLGVSDGVPKE